MNNINLAICIDSLTRSGTELQVKGLIEAFENTAVHPILITLKPSDKDLIPKNCTHFYLPLTKILSIDGIKAVFKLSSFLRKNNVDVIQCYFQDASIIGIIAARIARVNTKIVCFRDLGFWLTKKQKTVLNIIYKSADYFICNANMVAGFYQKEFNLPSDKMKVIRNGINIENLPYKSLKETTDIGIVGNMTRQVKRIDLFIKAAALLYKKYPYLTWHIVGDGYLRDELEALAKDLNVFSAIKFTGRINNVPEYLTTLDIGVISSDSEGLSNAIIEYMFTGTSVVATAVGGTPELIEHKKTGILVPPNDAAALAKGIEYFLINEEDRKTMTLAARHFVQRDYSWALCIDQHIEIYSQKSE